MLITIVGSENGLGLEKDKTILTEIIQDVGIDVDFRKFRHRLPLKSETDLCIHTEIVEPYYFGKKNILIPNQEWFLRKWLVHINRFDAIFCKTMYAKEIFSKYHDNVIYTGFTSKDYYMEYTKKSECFHAQGRSKAKGTKYVIEAWEKQDLPKLNLVSNQIRHRINSPNVTLFRRFLSANYFNRLRNSCLVHLCPSQAEGFGHYINESKSCGAVVITTDFAPMNELVSDFTLPVYKKRSYTNMLGDHVTVRPSDIGELVKQLFERNDLEEIGKRNRQSFLANDIRFKRDFIAALRPFSS